MGDSGGGTGGCLSLASHCALKRLETPALYDIRADALYELDEEGLRFLASGPRREEAHGSPETAALVDFCIAEGLLVETPAPEPVALPDAPLGDAALVRLICSDCPFYKEGEDEELECGAFMLLRHLLRKKVVTVKGILDAVQPADER